MANNIIHLWVEYHRKKEEKYVCYPAVKDDDGNIAGVTIACCGDEGLNAIMKALEFAHEVIDDQRCDVDD